MEGSQNVSFFYDAAFPDVLHHSTSIKLTIHSNVQTATQLCSTIAGSYPRDQVFANRERIILIVGARRHLDVLHVCSWKLPFVPEYHC